MSEPVRILVVEDDSELVIKLLKQLSERKAIAYCGHKLVNVGIDAFPEQVHIPHKDDSFRGGSIGKGGKVKYRRS